MSSRFDGPSRMQIVPAPEQKQVVPSGLPPKPLSAGGSSSAIVEYQKPARELEDEDLEVKLRKIIDHIPVRVSNTSGSSAGSGSGDFHQYRQMRRKEQDRLARMDVDYKKRKELAEFNMRREERMKAAEEITAKKRQKRQKKKQHKKEKQQQLQDAPSNGQNAASAASQEDLLNASSGDDYNEE